MKILIIEEESDVSGIEAFLYQVSSKLAATICKKLHAYTERNEISLCNRLKILNPKIWGYRGTIYKLRVDCGKESARILFTRTPDNDIVVLHGFLKKTRKTPAKEAGIAIRNLERLKDNVTVRPLPM